MDTNDLLSLIPDGHYAPSEVVLIGAHLHPSPAVKPSINENGKRIYSIDDEAADQLAEGTMKVNSDFTKTLKLVAVALEVESGSLEQLVLEANMPGNRSVSAYGAHMQMAHRGGKIS